MEAKPKISKELLELKHKKLIERINRLGNMFKLLSSISDCQEHLNSIDVIKSQYERMYNAVIESQDYEKYTDVENAIVGQLGKLELIIDRIVYKTYKDNPTFMIVICHSSIYASDNFRKFNNLDAELEKISACMELLRFYKSYASAKRFSNAKYYIIEAKLSVLLKRQIERIFSGENTSSNPLLQYETPEEKIIFQRLLKEWFGFLLEETITTKISSNDKYHNAKFKKEKRKKFLEKAIDDEIALLMNHDDSSLLDALLLRHISKTPRLYWELLNKKIFSSEMLFEPVSIEPGDESSTIKAEKEYCNFAKLICRTIAPKNISVIDFVKFSDKFRQNYTPESFFFPLDPDDYWKRYSFSKSLNRVQKLLFHIFYFEKYRFKLDFESEFSEFLKTNSKNSSENSGEFALFELEESEGDTSCSNFGRLSFACEVQIYPVFSSASSPETTRSFFINLDHIADLDIDYSKMKKPSEKDIEKAKERAYTIGCSPDSFFRFARIIREGKIPDYDSIDY